MISGQPQNVVFDGTRPLLGALVVARGAAFPWLLELTDTAGRPVDLSTTTVSGTTTTGWGGALAIARDFGDGGPLVIVIRSSTATASGSQITFPDAAGGKALIFVSPTDTALLPKPEDPDTAYCVYSLLLTDPNGVSYVVSRGVVYPQETVKGATS